MPEHTLAGRNLLLSFLPNFNVPLLGPQLEERLLPLLQKTLQILRPQIGRWRVVWGPAIYRIVPLGIADNTMVVLENDAGERFVSIAGTHPLSLFAWFIEDFQVDEMFPWLEGDAPPGAMIAEGTLAGLRALQGMVPPAAVPGAHTTLRDFLSTTPRPTTIAGHSLGGALAPVLGLWLSDTRSHWDPQHQVSLDVWAYASPAPGNPAFARHLNAQLGDGLHRVANQLDVVPSGWQVDELARLKALYAPDIERSPLWDSIIDITIAATNGQRFAQIDESPMILEGTLDMGRVGGRSALTDIITQLLYQHTAAYFALTGVDLGVALGQALDELQRTHEPECERTVMRRMRQSTWARSLHGIPRDLLRVTLHHLRRRAPALLRTVTPNRWRS